MFVIAGKEQYKSGRRWNCRS